MGSFQITHLYYTNDEKCQTNISVFSRHDDAFLYNRDCVICRKWDNE